MAAIGDPAPVHGVLHIVVPVHNRREVTVKFAKTLAEQTAKGFRLILVDDGSTDGTSEAVLRILPDTKVLQGDGSLWWAGGLQKGLNWLAAQNLSETSSVAFMNDDISFTEEFLEKALSELQSLGPGKFLVVPGIFQPSGRRSEEALICDWAHFRYRDFGRHPERIDCAPTRCLLMRWGDLQRVGGFHPTTLPHYASDFEFTIRARRKGLQLVPAQSVEAWFNELTTGAHSSSGLSRQARLRLMLSPRFSFQPLYTFLYIWYACPLVWKAPCWARLFWSTVKFLA